HTLFMKISLLFPLFNVIISYKLLRNVIKYQSDRRWGVKVLPWERQKKIKEWIQDEQHLRIADLSESLGVSEMTIHRDIKPLIQEGWIVKTFGGISLVQEQKRPHSNMETCVFCNQNVKTNLTYR